MKKSLLILSFLFSSLILRSQGILETPYVPPSPDSYALSKFANINSGTYTGVPSINIPLFDLDGPTFKIPISLSYNASGHKVQDIASSCGLGFSLMGGGVISRVVRGGVPDEHINGYSGKNHKGRDLDRAVNKDILSSEVTGASDPEPDSYFANFIGNSFRFTLDSAGKSVVIPFNRYIIKRIVDDNTHEITKWVIITPEGEEYTFGENTKEVTSYTVEGSSFAFEYPSSWFLEKIDIPNHPSIFFNYTSGPNITYTYFKNSSSTILGHTIYWGEHYENSREDLTEVGNQTFYSQNVMVTIKSPIYLSGIKTSKGISDFIYVPGREDIDGGYYLKDVIIRTPFNNVKSYTLNYGYFNSDNCTDQKCKRLKLDNIIEFTGPDHTAKPFNTFKYNTQVIYLPVIQYNMIVGVIIIIINITMIFLLLQIKMGNFGMVQIKKPTKLKCKQM